jgi:hypothetical protein
MFYNTKQELTLLRLGLDYAALYARGYIIYSLILNYGTSHTFVHRQGMCYETSLFLTLPARHSGMSATCAESSVLFDIYLTWHATRKCLVVLKIFIILILPNSLYLLL